MKYSTFSPICLDPPIERSLLSIPWWLQRVLHHPLENKESCKKLTEEWKKYKTPRAHKMVTDYLDKSSLDVDTVVKSMDW